MQNNLVLLIVHVERTEKFMQTGNTDFIYRNELDKACFQHDMAYDKSKDLTKRTQSDKVFLPIMMMFKRNKATKSSCSSTATTIYCAVGGKIKIQNAKF